MSKKKSIEKNASTAAPRKKLRRRRKKRGTDATRYYFDASTQQAIELYQSSEDAKEKSHLYVNRILPAFDQLVENLICIYKFTGLYTTHDELKNDCISFLYESLGKFDPTRGSKAFSYFNVVAKRWLIVRSKKRQVWVKKMVSLDAVDSRGKTEHERLEQLPHLAAHVDLIVPSVDDETIQLEKMPQLMSMLNEIRGKLTNENEIRCIDAIITLFEHRDNLPIDEGKRAVFTYIRELTGLTPKQLTMAVSVIKRHYNGLKMGDEYGIF